MPLRNQLREPLTGGQRPQDHHCHRAIVVFNSPQSALAFDELGQRHTLHRNEPCPEQGRLLLLHLIPDEAAPRAARLAFLRTGAGRLDELRGQRNELSTSIKSLAGAERQAAVDQVAPLFGSTAFSPRPYLLLGTVLAELNRIPEARRWLDVATRFPETRDEARRRLEALPGARPLPPPPAPQLDPSQDPS